MKIDKDIRNLTLSLPVQLIKKAKMLAINQNKSLSQLLRELLEVLVSNKNSYQAAMDRQLARMEKMDLGIKGKINWKRDDLYE